MSRCWSRRERSSKWMKQWNRLAASVDRARSVDEGMDRKMGDGMNEGVDRGDSEEIDEDMEEEVERRYALQCK